MNMKSVEEFLRKDPLRNAYQISMLDEERVKILVDDMEEPKGVILIRESTISMKGDRDILVDLFFDVEPGEYRFHSIDAEAFEAAKVCVRDIDDRPTWMLKRERDKFGEPKMDVVPLEEDEAHEINEYWGLGESDSTDYIKHRIKNGPAYGIYRDSELVAWSLTHRVTEDAMMLGFLHVKEEWRRKGFAKAITEKLCQDALEQGVTPVVDIFKDNSESLELAYDLGFEKIGEGHWFSGRVPSENN